MGSMNDFDRGKQAGYMGTGRGLPKSAAEAMGQEAGRNLREQQWRAGLKPGPQGESIVPKRVVYAIVGLVFVLPFMLGVVWSVAQLWSPGLRVVAITISVLGLLLAPLVRRLLGPAIGIYLGFFAGLGVASIENILNNRPVTMANLNFITFVFLILGLMLTLVLAMRGVKRRAPS